MTEPVPSTTTAKARRTPEAWRGKPCGCTGCRQLVRGQARIMSNRDPRPTHDWKCRSSTSS
eukprot:3822215-Lingulodinium_polyedra.AAC.1